MSKRTKANAATLLIELSSSDITPHIIVSLIKRVLPGTEDAESYPDTRFISPREVPTALGNLWTDNGDLVLQAYLPKAGGQSYERTFWGSTLGYRRPHWVDLRTAKDMMSALDKIVRALTKLADRFGHAEDFDSRMMRFADVLGVTNVYVSRKVQVAAGRPEWMVEDYKEVTVQDAAYMIRRIEELAQPAKESAVAE